MIPLLDSPAAQRLAWTLLHFLWQGTLLGLAAWSALALLRRRSPQLRYLVGCAFLLACLGSAVVTYGLLASPASAPRSADGASVLLWSGIRNAPGVAPEDVTAPVSEPWQTRVQPFLPWILAAWAAGVLLLSLRTAGGWLWLRRLRDTAAPIEEPDWLERLERGSGLRRAVRFLESARVTTPMCMGLLRPVILLPLGFFTNLDPLAAEAVLAHELAHIRRLDGVVNGLQCAVEVLFFYHPAVWWISRRVRTEREHCCDDAAVLACGDALYYAETLSRLDELRDRPPSLALQAGGGNLLERMRRLLLADPPQLRFATPSLLLIATLALVSTLPAQAEKIKMLLPIAEGTTSISTPANSSLNTLRPPLPLPAMESGTVPRTVALRSLEHLNPELPATPGHVVPPRPAPVAPPSSTEGTTSGTQSSAKTQAVVEVPPSSKMQVETRSPISRTSPTASAPLAPVDCGPRPTMEEALRYISIMADKALWGPRTLISDVQVDEKVRWHAGLTARWPKGESISPTIEGWEITFLAKSSMSQAMYRPRKILVDGNRVIYWQTLGEWDTRENILPNRNK